MRIVNDFIFFFLSEKTGIFEIVCLNNHVDRLAFNPQYCLVHVIEIFFVWHSRVDEQSVIMTRCWQCKRHQSNFSYCWFFFYTRKLHLSIRFIERNKCKRQSSACGRRLTTSRPGQCALTDHGIHLWQSKHSREDKLFTIIVIRVLCTMLIQCCFSKCISYAWV